MVLLPAATLPAMPDHEGHARRGSPRKVSVDAVQALRGGHVEAEQARERQVDVRHLLQRDLLVDAPQLRQLGLGERHLRCGR